MDGRPTQPGLFDPPAPYSNQTTSKAAAQAIKAALPHLEQVVLDGIRAAAERGACCHELEASLAMAHTTVSARIRGLVLKGKVVDSGEKRETPAGRNAIVWRLA